MIRRRRAPASRATSAAWRAVEWPTSAARVGLFLGERRLVDQEVGVARQGAPAVAGCRVEDVGEDGARLGRADQAVGAELGAVVQRDRLAALERLELPALGDAGGARRRAVDGAGALALREAVAGARHAVLQRTGLDRERLVLEHDRVLQAGVPLADLDAVGRVALLEARRGTDEVAQAGRPDDRERGRALQQRQRGQQARQAVEVVAVEVRDEDRFEVAAAQPAAQDLKLRRLAAVEEEQRALAADGRPGQVARARRHRRAGTEGDDVEHVGRAWVGRSYGQPARRDPRTGHRASGRPARRVYLPARRRSSVCLDPSSSPGCCSPRAPPARRAPRRRRAACWTRWTRFSPCRGRTGPPPSARRWTSRSRRRRRRTPPSACRRPSGRGRSRPPRCASRARRRAAACCSCAWTRAACPPRRWPAGPGRRWARRPSRARRRRPTRRAPRRTSGRGASSGWATRPETGCLRSVVLDAA